MDSWCDVLRKTSTLSGGGGRHEPTDGVKTSGAIRASQRLPDWFASRIKEVMSDDNRSTVGEIATYCTLRMRRISRCTFTSALLFLLIPLSSR
jgi:hypothetical protein